MQTRRLLPPVFLLAAILPAAAQEGAKEPLPTVPEIIAKLQARERAAKTVMLTMRSRTTVPDGPTFETEGTLRVLGTTHFHVKMRMRADEGIEGQHEVVTTPEGSWTREVNPMQGEVITRMSKETMAALKEAEDLLGEDGPPGAVPGQSEAPLGSAMLASLAKHFDLAVQGKIVRNGLDHWLLRGDVRPGVQGEVEGPVPDRVEVLVQVLKGEPFAVARMTQFDDGAEVMTVEINDVQLDLPLAESSFQMDTKGRRVIDVMDHPEAAAQIREVLDRAKAKREEKGNAKDGKDGGQDRGK
ncbi:MAG TPA: hypothetical protein VK081_04045 [Planctomycetota bacterium]|nr:hypothetical protein [Planctomycetota bacterium]